MVGIVRRHLISIWVWWFRAACSVVSWLFRIGAPGWVVNCAGAVCGTSYAWWMAYHLGYEIQA